MESPTISSSVSWAELAVVDLGKARTPGGRSEQVKIAKEAMHKQGFFYVVNHGFDQAQVCFRSHCLYNIVVSNTVLE